EFITGFGELVDALLALPRNLARFGRWLVTEVPNAIRLGWRGLVRGLTALSGVARSLGGRLLAFARSGGKTVSAVDEIAGAGSSILKAPFNPSGSLTNCVNSVAAFLNSVRKGRLVTASADVAENLGSIERANRQIAAQTGIVISARIQESTLLTARV